MKPETQNKIESKARAMLELLWKWIKRFGSAMVEASQRYHDTPPKEELKAGKPRTLTERKAARRQKKVL